MSFRRLALAAALAGAVALTAFALLRDRGPAGPAAERPAAAGADAAPKPAGVAGAHILIAHRDGRPSLPGVTRTREEAQELAVRLSAEILDNRASFAELARRYSDDARTAALGGEFGLVRTGQLPLPLEVGLARLEVGDIDPCVESPAGFHVLMRVPVRRAVARHVMITWKGAGGDFGTISRSREQARALADEIAAKARAAGADFCELAARFSDDEQSRFGCGLIGLVRPGDLEPSFEDTLFSLPPGGISGVVETTFGFHVVKRDPELP